MIRDIILSVISCVFLSVTLRVPLRFIPYTAIGSMLTAGIHRLMIDFYGEMISCMTAVIVLSCFCEIIARVHKIPAVVIIMPSTIPLLPGGYLYYTIFSYFTNNAAQAQNNLRLTITAGTGIALGSSITAIIIRLTTSNKKIFDKRN